MAEHKVDVVIPVYNEESDLAACVRRLDSFLAAQLPYPYRITVADNASTDSTLAIARELAAELAHVEVIHLDAKGRGRALSTVWSRSDATILAYMDVDLSTDLAALLPLVAPLISGHSDVSIGTRLAPNSRVIRGARREVISRCYNAIVRGTLAANFSDAQCGFKAIRRQVAIELLPYVKDTGWFFDTELLVLAEQAGLRIHEVPVDWIDDPDSRVKVVATAIADLKGIARMRRALSTGAIPIDELRHRLARPVPGAAGADPSQKARPSALPRQLISFASVGVFSTLAYVSLFAILRLGIDAQSANLVALLSTAIANTAANRRVTFGVVGRRHLGRHQLQGLAVFGLGLGLTSGSLAMLHLVNGEPGRLPELAVLVVANLAATVARFLLLRLWVFADAPPLDARPGHLGMSPNSTMDNSAARMTRGPST